MRSRRAERPRGLTVGRLRGAGRGRSEWRGPGQWRPGPRAIHSAVSEVVTRGPSRDPLRLDLAAPLLPKSHGTLRPESRREVVVNGQFPSAKVSDCAQYSGNSANEDHTSPPHPQAPSNA